MACSFYLKRAGPFREVSSLFLNYSAPVPFGPFSHWFSILKCSNPSRPVYPPFLKHSTRVVGSFLANCASYAPVRFERFASCFSNALVPFERFARCFSNALVPIEQFASCFSTTTVRAVCYLFAKHSSSFRTHCSLLLAYPSPLRAVCWLACCHILSYTIISFERFAFLYTGLPSNTLFPFRAACSLFLKYSSPSRAICLMLMLKYPSPWVPAFQTL